MEPKTTQCRDIGTFSPYIMTNGVMEIRFYVPFIVRAANLTPNPIGLNKGMIMGTATSDPSQVIALVDDPPPLSKISDDDKGTTGPWREDISICYLSLDEQRRVTKMLAKHSEMWNRKLGEISVTKHRIELTPNLPVYQAPYRAGNRYREIELVEIRTYARSRRK
jgi:hypothetical protein